MVFELIWKPCEIWRYVATESAESWWPLRTICLNVLWSHYVILHGLPLHGWVVAVSVTFTLLECTSDRWLSHNLTFTQVASYHGTMLNSLKLKTVISHFLVWQIKFAFWCMVVDYFYQFLAQTFSWIGSVCWSCPLADIPSLKKSLNTLHPVAKYIIILKNGIIIINLTFYQWNQKSVQNLSVILCFYRWSNDCHFLWAFTWHATPYHTYVVKSGCFFRELSLCVSLETYCRFWIITELSSSQSDFSFYLLRIFGTSYKFSQHFLLLDFILKVVV